MNVSSGLAEVDQPVSCVYSPVFAKEQASAAAFFSWVRILIKSPSFIWPAVFGKIMGT